ncbi:MAG: hypothetical protein KKC01_09450 [Gammaproteobacteria bacterium]|nr:hypothetical protein [Gammaproteobacteria bacterium]
MKENPKLQRLDPESEACFETLRGRILEELSSRVALGEDPTTSDGQEALAELIADAVLDSFVVRKRIAPRYQWLDQP